MLTHIVQIILFLATNALIIYAMKVWIQDNHNRLLAAHEYADALVLDRINRGVYEQSFSTANEDYTTLRDRYLKYN